MNRLKEGVAGIGRSIMAAFSQIWFAQPSALTLLFIAATFLSPWKGAAGLFCLLVTNGTAHLLGFERKRILAGEFGLNGLLVGLSLSAIYTFNFRFLAVLAVAGIMTAVLTRAVTGFLGPLMGLPALSLPFVLATFGMYLAARSFTGLEVARWTLPFITEDVFSSPVAFVRVYLQSLGAVFLQSGVTSGLLVFLGLLLASRIATVLSLVGFTSGVLFYQFLGATTADITYDLVGFNFILTAIALGGVFVVPSIRSYLLAALAAALCAALGCGFKELLLPYNLPVLAVPFNFTVLLFIYCLKFRETGPGLDLVDFAPGSPEQNLAFARTRLHRMSPGESLPWLLPVKGEWTVWQGAHGSHTHQGPGQWAWDFVVHGEDGETHREGGTVVEDYRAYGLPIYSPGPGLVIRTVRNCLDVGVGEIDSAAPWGNHVVIQHAPGIYSTTAHFKPGTIEVAEGQPVAPGQVLGLVGNTGRSPQPHLHIQFQKGPEPTGRTIPASFGPVLLRQEDGWELRRRHRLEEGDRVTSLAEPAERFSFPLRVGDSMAFQVTVREARGDGTTELAGWTETWTVQADLSGRTFIQEDRFGGMAFFRYEEGVFLMVDFLGSRRSALRAFFLGATTICLDDRPGIRWRDVTPAKHLLPGWIGLLQFASSPFLAVWTLETAFRFSQERRCEMGGAPVEVRTVESEIRRGGPWSSRPIGKPLRTTRVTLSPQLGPLMVEARGRKTILRGVRVSGE